MATLNQNRVGMYRETTELASINKQARLGQSL